MADLSILLAHKRDATDRGANDRALAVALECLLANTHHDYELLLDTTTPADPYAVWNRLARQASCEYVVFTNSDVFMGPNWDVPMLNAARNHGPDVIVTGVLVEPGAIGVHVMNYHRDFGMTPESFQRPAFEDFVRAGGEWRDGPGWYMPSLHHRDAFLERGGFDTSLGEFPDELDSVYWHFWTQSGRTVQRVPSYAYHLQNYSNPAEQQKAVRHR